MHTRHALRTALAVACVATGIAGSALAQQSDSDTAYSATAIHQFPGLPETSGTVVKSGEKMRLEFDQNGSTVIQILLPEKGIMYVLDPNTKTYLEMKGQATPAEGETQAATPCTDQSGLAVCQRTGTDTVSGIQVERWSLATQSQSQPLTILWDPTRRQALRQDFPDGSSMAMRFKAMETVNGRETERWLIEVLAPGRETLTGGWWFDPELRIVVREDLPGGESRRLENISIGAVDPATFALPEGWTKRDPTAITTPQAPQSASD